MFTQLYELLIGTHDDPTFAESIFPSVGFITLALSLIVALAFYLALGRWKPIWHKLFHWVMTLIGLMVTSFVLGLTQAKGAIGAPEADFYMIKFAIVNAIFSFLYFILFSFLMKKASIFAKRTPF